MLQQQISLNADLKRLRDEGYQIEVCDGHLFAHHIPYVNNQGQVQYGSLVSSLDLSGTKTVKPRTHVIMFSGEQPCDKTGNVIQQISHGASSKGFINGTSVNLSFSNKPAGGYSDYYEKISNYSNIISAPAKALDENVTEKPFKPVTECNDENSVFKYFDTNSSRANIESINDKLKGQKIAIVGLGGTGAYVLDLVAKTSVQEIHLWDGDILLNHNAFRSPGAISIETLEKQPFKTRHYIDMYAQMRNNLFEHCYYVQPSNFHELKQFNYVFLCIDDNTIRNQLIRYLTEELVPIIDVGLGLSIVNNQILGSIRVTTSTQEKNNHLDDRIPVLEDVENEYASNIQIADLNAFNAFLAVMKWKKHSGFYQDLVCEHNTVYSLNDGLLLNEDEAPVC